jgi:peptidyl-prolyl cis-trans isomerase SurA
MFQIFLKKGLQIIFFLMIGINNVLCNEVSIKFKINNEIITNIDIEKEYNYLIALNTNLQSIEKSKVYEIAEMSLIKEIVKKIELKKYFDLDQNQNYMSKIVKDFYEGLGIKNEEEFKSYLKQYELKLDDVKKKLEIEAIWNEFIYKRYNDQVKIDEIKLKKILKEKIKNGTNQKKYLLSEIFFNAQSTSELMEKYNLIKNNIKESGFENTANKFSESDSSRNGGDIGWIKDSQLSDIIRKNIIDLTIGKYSEVINLPGGNLIIKVNDIKEEKIKLNFEEEFKKLILYEKNRQLNQFSIIYFNRIKQNANYSKK